MRYFTALLLVLMSGLRAEAQTPRLSLADCVGISRQHAAIAVRRSEQQIAAAKVAMARSHLLPQVNFGVKHGFIDESRSVTIDNLLTPQLRNTLSDSSAFFGLAQQFGTTAALNAFDNPNTPIFSGGPTFNGVKTQAGAAIPNSVQVDLLGTNFLSTQLSIVQPLWTGGKISSRYGQSKLLERNSALAFERMQQEITFNVTRAYLSVLFARESHRFAVDVAERTRHTEDIAKDMEKLSKVDVYRVSIAKGMFKELEIEARHNIDRAAAALRLAMGVNQDWVFKLDRVKLPKPQAWQISYDEIAGTALAQRPEVRQARHGVRLAQLERRHARAQFLPDIAAYAGMSSIRDNASFANPNDPEEWTLGIVGQIPISTGGRNLANVLRSRHLESKARNVSAQISLLVHQQARDAHILMRQKREQWQIAGEAAMAAENAMKAHEKELFRSIRNDRAPKYFEDLLMLRTLLLRARTRLANAIFSYNLAMARANLVMGRSVDISREWPLPAEEIRSVRITDQSAADISRRRR